MAPDPPRNASVAGDSLRSVNAATDPLRSAFPANLGESIAAAAERNVRASRNGKDPFDDIVKKLPLVPCMVPTSRLVEIVCTPPGKEAVEALPPSIDSLTAMRIVFFVWRWIADSNDKHPALAVCANAITMSHRDLFAAQNKSIRHESYMTQMTVQELAPTLQDAVVAQAAHFVNGEHSTIKAAEFQG